MLEFWPVYGAGPLWLDGRAVDVHSLGLPQELARQLEVWNGQYEESKMPLEGAGDAEWLGQGMSIPHETRSALGTRFSVVVTEPWWDEEPTYSRQNGALPARYRT